MQKRFFIIPFPVWGNAWITMWKFLRWQWMSGAVAASIHPASLHRSPVCFLLKRTLSWASAWEFFFFFSVLSFEQPAVSSAPNVPNFNGDTKTKTIIHPQRFCPSALMFSHVLWWRPLGEWRRIFWGGTICFTGSLTAPAWQVKSSPLFTPCTRADDLH